jgi:hypothetical protein
LVPQLAANKPKAARVTIADKGFNKRSIAFSKRAVLTIKHCDQDVAIKTWDAHIAIPGFTGRCKFSSAESLELVS